MDVLGVEERLGAAVETWPTYILLDLFVEDPNIVSVREIAGFMYGNGVPIREATQCFQMCNAGRRAFIEQNMVFWYKEWNRSPYKPYLEKYYCSVKDNGMDTWKSGWWIRRVSECTAGHIFGHSLKVVQT